MKNDAFPQRYNNVYRTAQYNSSFIVLYFRLLLLGDSFQQNITTYPLQQHAGKADAEVLNR